MKHCDFTKEQEAAFIALTEKGVAAAFIYSSNVCANGKLYKYDENNRNVRTVAISGIVFVPSAFFSRFLGVEETRSENTVKFKNGEISVTVKIDSEEYSTDSGSGKFIKPVYNKNGVVYVPALELAKLLGFAAGSYYEDRFIVVGNAETIGILDKDEKTVLAGCYAIFGEYDISGVTKEDYKRARDKWRLMLIGNEKINDMSNPYFRTKIEGIEERGEKSYATMNKEGDPPILWGDAPPVECDELSKQYSGIRNIAMAYATYGSKYYHNEDYLKAVIFGMDWMFDHMFGEAEITNTGWRDTHAFNWWYWFVGAPDLISDILFAIEDKVTMEDKRRYLKAFEHIATWMCTTEASTLTRICVCTKIGLILEDPKYLNKEYEDFDKLLELKEKGTPRIDYCDFTHGFPYNLAYGMLNLDRVLRVASMLAGTPFEYTSPQLYNQFGLAKYMFEPAIYRAQGYVMFLGRSTLCVEERVGANTIINLLPMIGVFGEDEDKYLKRFIKRNSVNDFVTDTVKRSCSYETLALYMSILEDDSISAENDYEIGYAWFTGDRVTQQRNNYAVGIAMTSKREFAYESINQANQTGWYTGDGAIYLYTTYDNAQYDGKNFITNNIKVAYNFPGTTEDAREREARSILGGEAWRPSKSFVGGMDFDGKYVVAAMDFESEYFDGPDKNIKDTGYGTGRAVHKNDLHSKKAWFCFDNEIISMSAGITSTMNSPVNTTVEHRRIVKEDKFSQKIKKADGGLVTLDKGGYYYRYSEPQWAIMEGHCGYVFLEKNNLLVNRYTAENAENQPFFLMSIEHSENPKDASYAYAMIPYATEEQLDAYYANPDVEIISNTAKLQAVREKNLSISAYVFHQAGKCEAIETSEAAILMIKEKDGKLVFRITDPTHELESATVIIDKPLSLKEKHKKLTVAEFADKTVITVDFAESNGRPYTAIFDLK